MKLFKKSIFFSLLAIIMLSSLKSFGQGVTDFTLEGKIDKYPIVMEIEVFGGGPVIVGGSYYYKSKGPDHWIMLSDDLNLQKGGGIYPILEESVGDKVTGTFHATHWDMETMRGTWISANGSKQLSFSLKVVKSVRHYIE